MYSLWWYFPRLIPHHKNNKVLNKEQIYLKSANNIRGLKLQFVAIKLLKHNYMYFCRKCCFSVVLNLSKIPFEVLWCSLSFRPLCVHKCLSQHVCLFFVCFFCFFNNLIVCCSKWKVSFSIHVSFILCNVMLSCICISSLPLLVPYLFSVAFLALPLTQCCTVCLHSLLILYSPHLKCSLFPVIC